MAVEHDIQQIDEEGMAGNVLSDYQVNTISLVNKGALGRNITKLKSNEEFIETEEGKAIMSKIDKAKALDAEQAELEAVASEEVVETEKSKSAEEQTPEVEAEVSEDAPEETSEVEAVVEQTEEENPSEDVTEASEEESEPVEKAKAEDKAKEEDEDEKEKVEADPEGEEEEDAKKAVEPKNEDEKVEKQKMYSMDEYLEASKSALDGMVKLVGEVKEKAPEADHWEVFNIVYDTVNSVDNADWLVEDAKWSKVWSEAYQEVADRTSKAKSLKIAEEATLDDKLKALEASDPALAALFRENSQKALHAEQEREAVIRAKAREEGAEKYKRISSEECTTDQITDTMMDLEVSNPDAYSVLAKALDNASVITSAGELFRDVGSSDTVNTMAPDEFVEAKAKSLAAEKDKAGESYNMAALRATVRQSDEYVANYA